MRLPTAATLGCALALMLAPASPASARPAGLDRAVLAAVNAQRAAQGLRPLRLSGALDRAARSHSRAMAHSGVLTHSPDLLTRVPRPRARAAWALGETIAWLPARTRHLAARVVSAWMHSPAHRAVLLDPSFRLIGVGAGRGSGGTFLTADLAS